MNEVPTDLVISGHWLQLISDAAPDAEVELSFDLGRSRVAAHLTRAEVSLPDGVTIPRKILSPKHFKPQDCYEVFDTELKKIYSFAGDLGRYYKLYHAQADWPPTIVINNAPMHMISECSPRDDTERKLSALARAAGARSASLKGCRLLDTCFGLGYSAQLAEEMGAGPVISCEVDANVLRVAERNPWSTPAFRSSVIDVLNEDARKVVAESPTDRFDVIMHDPPTLTLAGDLYSDALYADLLRILKPGGRLYHYTGDPGGRLGRDLPAKVAQRLKDAGFKSSKKAWGGVTAVKPE